MRIFLLAVVAALVSPLAAQPADPASASANEAGDAPDLAVSWSPEPVWLTGAGRYRFFEGGLDYGTHFIYSSVPDRLMPPVEIVFDQALESRGRVFDYRAGLRDVGVGTFRGAAYDVSDPARPRRLNVGFIEDAQQSAADRVWNPDGSPTGAHEFLFVFASDYAEGASQYAGATAYGLDVYYGLYPRVRDGATLYQTAATLTLTPAPLREVTATATENGQALVSWVDAAFLEATEVRVRDGAGLRATVAPEDGAVTLTGLDPSRAYDLTVDLVADGEVVASRAASVRPQVSLGVAGASSLDPGRAQTSTYGDLWGYTAPDGTEYALLAARGAGLSVIDITGAPAQAPVEVGFLAAPPGTSDSKDVKVFGQTAYVVNEVGPIQIVDLSDPTAPVQVGLLDVQPGVPSGGAHNVLVARDHLWVTGGRTAGNAGVRAYSLADPTAPVLVGEFRPDHQAVPYYHDFEVVGDRGYGPAIYADGGVDVLDVSDPSDIRLVTTFTYPGAGAHNTCTSDDGRTVYVGDEIGTRGNWMRIFDVSDVEDPELVGEIVVDRQAAVHNCYVHDGRLWVAHYTEGLRVFSLADPHAPVEVALFDTFRRPGYGYRGAWTAYPFFASGKTVVSDMQSGLWVVALGQSVDAASAPDASLPLRFWPNPVAGAATVAYDLVAPASVRLTLVDVLGRELAILDNGARGAGPHRAEVDASGLPAGVYVARLAIDGRVRAGVPVTVVR